MLLKKGNREPASWLLNNSDLRNFASVLITHKRYFLSTKLFDSTVEETFSELGLDLYANGFALSAATFLYYAAPNFYGEAWDEVLKSFQVFLRARDASAAAVALANFNNRLDELPRRAPIQLLDLVSWIREGSSHLSSLSELQLGNGIATRLQAGDPLLSAIGSTVGHWYQRKQRSIEVLHDETPILTPERILALRQSFDDAQLIAPSSRSRGHEFAGLRTCDSKNDARIQVADLIAGVAREVFEQLVHGREHPLYQDLLPLVSDETMWPRPAFLSQGQPF